MRGSRGVRDRGSRPVKKLGFLSNTGLDPLRSHKATKPAFNAGPLLAIASMVFRWQADDGPLLVVFGSLN